MRPLASWDCGSESRRGHTYLSFDNVVYCQVEVSATDRLLVQSSPTECGVSEWTFNDELAKPQQEPSEL